jgi:ketosteroid isomerase-like protein
MSLPAVFLVLASASGLHAAALPQDLTQAANAYDRAQFSNDIPSLGSLVTDDFVLVNSDGSVENKQQFLADFNLPGFKIDPYRIERPIRKIWSSGAVIAGLVRLHWTQDGKSQIRDLRVAYVWQKSGGHWRVIYAQVTRVGAS